MQFTKNDVVQSTNHLLLFSFEGLQLLRNGSRISGSYASFTWIQNPGLKLEESNGVLVPKLFLPRIEQ